MKWQDAAALIFISALLTVFLLPAGREIYDSAYSFSPLLLSFIKFALLATFGEMLSARIASGSYRISGPLPKAVIWGFLGIIIHFAFIIFSQGVMGIFQSELPLINAFLISLFMNVIFAPPMMLFHHLTDTHIHQSEGKFPLKSFSMLELLKQADWEKMWGFVFAKTIPFFWIPAHTITFMLPDKYRVLFAALLSIALGILLSLRRPQPRV
jgi:hypothetical protein